MIEYGPPEDHAFSCSLFHYLIGSERFVLLYVFAVSLDPIFQLLHYDCY